MSKKSLSVGHFRFDLTVTDEIVLPPYKGFAFRGVFGTVLKELACVIPGEVCPRCPFKHTCTYAYLFETSPAEGIDGLRRFSNFPRPYIIHPPLGDKHQFKRYDAMSFEFILIGRASECIPQVIMTFEEIGIRGIRNGHGKYMIDKVTSVGENTEEQIIFNKGTLSGSVIPLRTIFLQKKDELRATEVTLEFNTPLLLEERGKPHIGPPQFGFLIENLVRRITLLQLLHGAGEVECNQAETLLEQTQSIKIKHTNLHWLGMQRISNRQQSRIKTGGLMGHITYIGNLTPYIPYLRAGELLHVGKSTTFGFGGYRLQSC